MLLLSCLTNTLSLLLFYLVNLKATLLSLRRDLGKDLGAWKVYQRPLDILQP